MANPAGESDGEVLRLDFDRRLMVQFRGSVVTSDAGLLAYRELADALGLSALASEMLADARTGRNGRHALVGMLLIWGMSVKGSAVHAVAHICPDAVHAVAQAGRWGAILKGMEGIGLNGLCVIVWLEWASDPWAGIAPTTRTSSGTPFWLQFAMINFMCAAKAVAGELESVPIGLSDGRGRPMTLSAISRT
jgi:hypothetical protein